MITLRSLTEVDAPMVYSLIDISRSNLKNLVWSGSATLESTAQFIREKSQSTHKIFGIFHQDNFTGVLELRDLGDVWELGYWLGTPYRRQGIMKMAAKMLVSQVVAKKPVTAHIRVTNIASYKTLCYAGLVRSYTKMWEGEEWLHMKTP